MTWVAEYSAPNGISGTLDAVDWVAGANMLRAMIDAAMPEFIYDDLVHKLRNAEPDAEFEFRCNRVRATLTGGGAVHMPAQRDLFGAMP